MDAWIGNPELHGDELVWKPAEESADIDMLRPASDPFQADGGMRLVQGNLGRAVFKTSAVDEERWLIEAPARCFSDQNEVLEAFKAGELDRDVAVVVRFQGPRANGMPELHKLTPTLGVLQDRGFKVALVTDGRMSGASGKVPAAIHVSPEALARRAAGAGARRRRHPARCARTARSRRSASISPRRPPANSPPPPVGTGPRAVRVDAAARRARPKRALRRCSPRWKRSRREDRSRSPTSAGPTRASRWPRSRAAGSSRSASRSRSRPRSMQASRSPGRNSAGARAIDLPNELAIAFAGPVGGEMLKLTNNPWVIRPALIKERLGVDRYTIVNDFGAVAYAVATLGDEHFQPYLRPGRAASRQGVISIVGPGTGLGVAALLRKRDGYEVIETEGGHIDFAPLDSLEDRILDRASPQLPPRLGRADRVGQGLVEHLRSAGGDRGPRPHLPRRQGIVGGGARRQRQPRQPPRSTGCA